MPIHRLEIPLAKAEYLLNYETGPGEGGDKRKFWRTIMGFRSAETVRATLFAKVSLDMLQPRGRSTYGDLYEATVSITDPSGHSWRIRTNWIVLFDENIARFVTAFPERRRK